MTRVVVVDLLCNSPYYCGPLAAALRQAGADAELASPRFYLEPDFLDPYPRAGWVLDLVVHASRPRIVRLFLRSLELTINGARLYRRIRSGRYDVVHLQWIPFDDRSSVIMRILRRVCDRSGTLLVRTTHNAMPHDRVGADAKAMRRNLDLAHLLVVHTEHVAREVKEAVGTTSPVVRIPHGPLFIDRPLPPESEALARLGLAPAPTILFLGLIRQYKGVDLLLAAWPHVVRTNPDARLLVVGHVRDDASKADLALIRRLPGVDVMDAYVSVSSMLDYYAVSHLVVFPYHRISQSGALMTAAGLGRPTVVTPVDGLLEQVAVLTSAVVADDVSGPAIARAIAKGLSRVDELRRAALHDRESIVGSPVGWPAIASETIKAYTSLRV